MVAPFLLVVEVLHEAIQRLDERIQAGALGPHEPVAVDVSLGVARNSRVSPTSGESSTRQTSVLSCMALLSFSVQQHMYVLYAQASSMRLPYICGARGRQERNAQRGADEWYNYCGGGDLHGEKGALIVSSSTTAVPQYTCCCGTERCAKKRPGGVEKTSVRGL